VVGLGIFSLASDLGRGGIRSDDTRAKGDAFHLSLFRKTGTGVERLADGATAHARDLVQVGYSAGAGGFGAIFSIDGRGTVTYHLPEGYSGGSRAAPDVDGKGEAVLPSAYELDDAPRFERFFFVYSAKPFGLEELDRSARSLAADPRSAETGRPRLPAGSSLSSLILRKGASR
jgi:hypothetical protein